MLALLGALLGTVAVVPAAGARSGSQDPPYSLDIDTLDAALDCDPFTNQDTEPVLLVHGTGTTGHEQWDWNYGILLRETGHDVCIVTYPDRGYGDQQISAEYIARAVQRIHAESGRRVDLIGHSQGASMPRWAIKWWPSVRDALDDVVLLAGPLHGTSIVGGGGSPPTGMPPAFFQFGPNSNFIQTINEGDETPGDIDYTTVYTRYDELVQPVEPPTAALDLGLENPRVTNILLQDVCPLNVADHLTIGTVDRLTQVLVLDAIDNDGPTDLQRIGVDPQRCALDPLYVAPETLPNLLAQLRSSAEAGFPDFETVNEEPPLRDYARPQTTHETGGTSTTATVPSEELVAEKVDTLPATGRVIPLLAAGIAVGVAIMLRLGQSGVRS